MSKILDSGIVHVTVAVIGACFCAFFFSQCEQRELKITCDVNQTQCREFLEKVIK